MVWGQSALVWIAGIPGKISQWRMSHYSCARATLLQELSPALFSTLQSAQDRHHFVTLLFGCRNPADSEVIARFACRIRQTRRKMRLEYSQTSDYLKNSAYQRECIAWKADGHSVCCVFWLGPMPLSCPCVTLVADPKVWEGVRFMLLLSVECRALIVVPFN
jgi:hypothetical protein